MDIILFGDTNVLAFLSCEHTLSPEDLLIELEDALESGRLTIEEITLLLHDYNHRC